MKFARIILFALLISLTASTASFADYVEVGGTDGEVQMPFCGG